MRMSNMLASILCLSLALSLCFTIGYSATIEPIPIEDVKLIDVKTDTSLIKSAVTVPDLKLWGTEYAVGEQGKVWLQLLNSSSQPIPNSTCFVTVWYPNNTMFLNSSTMSYLSDGIHYKDFTVPDSVGVYPQTAMCSVPQLIANYSTTNYTMIAYDDLETGTGNDGTGSWISDWGFDNDGYCGISGSGSPIGSYHIRCTGQNGWAFRLSYPSIVENVANVTFWAKFGSLESGDSYHFEVFSEQLGDWKTYRSWTDGEDDDTYRRYTFTVEACVSGIMIRFRADTSSLADYGYFDNITVSEPELFGYYQMNQTQYQYIFGSGEVHVSEPLSNLNTNLSLSMDKVLSYIVAFSPQNLLYNHNICLDNETLLHMLTYQNCIGGDCFTYQKNETEACVFGCYNDTLGTSYCAPAPFYRWIWIAILIVIVIVVLLVLFWRY